MCLLLVNSIYFLAPLLQFHKDDVWGVYTVTDIVGAYKAERKKTGTFLVLAVINNFVGIYNPCPTLFKAGGSRERLFV